MLRPELGRCVPQECSCVARTDDHIALMRERIAEMKRQMPYVPEPLQRGLANRIQDMEAIIADHEQNGIQDQASGPAEAP